MKQRGEGFQKPISRTSKPVGLAVVKDDTVREVGCSCGWAYTHKRGKVRSDAGQRHIEKKHNGRGVWL